MRADAPPLVAACEELISRGGLSPRGVAARSPERLARSPERDQWEV